MSQALEFDPQMKKMSQALEFDPYDGKFIPPEKRGTDIDYFRGPLNTDANADGDD